MVEGTKIIAELIPKKYLSNAWKKLSNKPLPNVRALKLSDDDFNNILRQKHCLENEIREIKEWGRVLSTKGTDACVFSDESDDSDYIILVRENPYHSLDEIILHELSHIARGDL